MAKDKERSTSKEEKKEKKKNRHSEANGVTKEKRKKDKSHKSDDESTTIVAKLEEAKPARVKVDVEADSEDEQKPKLVITKELLVGAMVPFANPLADEKTMKKVLRGVKRSAKQKALKRGVKEVVKALRKTPTPATTSPPAVVVLAADISPADVISHIPVLCEDHNVPYIYVPSRAELGAAGSTKRPTSVVMVTPQAGKKKGKDDEDGKEDWSEVYADLAKVVEKAGRTVKV